MKTTRKGFTLIELIVVIAIIGVLAAILVPAMLGWVKKSKIQAANADAKTIMTNINAGIEELDEEGYDPVADKWYDLNKINADEAKKATAELIQKYAAFYGDTLNSTKCSFLTKDGVAICCVVKNGKYYGTYPAVLTNKNYDDKMGESKDLAAAKKVAEKEYNDNHASN